mgnify:CR=1 FL=1
MVQGAGLANTASAWPSGTMPRNSISAAPDNATTSTGYFSDTKVISIPATISKAIAGCIVAGRSSMIGGLPHRAARLNQEQTHEQQE